MTQSCQNYSNHPSLSFLQLSYTASSVHPSATTLVAEGHVLSLSFCFLTDQHFPMAACMVGPPPPLAVVNKLFFSKATFSVSVSLPYWSKINPRDRSLKGVNDFSVENESQCCFLLQQVIKHDLSWFLQDWLSQAVPAWSLAKQHFWKWPV